MDSQEGIELSKLRARRFSDHYATRAGATSRPVSQASTTDQASESTGIPQHISPIFPGSDCEIAASSSDESPLVSEVGSPPGQSKDVRTPNEKRKDSIPWTLRRSSLLGLIAIVLALIAALEVLHHFSNKNQGLVTTDQNASYLWKYLPTASK
jgi:hypothetical protein